MGMGSGCTLLLLRLAECRSHRVGHILLRSILLWHGQVHRPNGETASWQNFSDFRVNRVAAQGWPRVTERYFIKGRDLNLKATVSGNFSLTGTADGYEIEIDVSRETVPPQFVEAGHENMKVWADKYLVIRRDGTVPEFPAFVLGARDPWAPAALRAYALAAKEAGADAEYTLSLMDLADAFDRYRSENGAGDPAAGLHRADDPSIVQVMRDGRGGRIHIAAVWDKDQRERERQKDQADVSRETNGGF